MVKRLTYCDHEGRARFTNHGMHIYCSSQATADVLYKYEERIEKQLPPKEQELPERQLKMNESKREIVIFQIKDMLFRANRERIEEFGAFFENGHDFLELMDNVLELLESN